MNGVKGCRIVAVNLGATDLEAEVAFWEAVFEARFEPSSDPGGWRIVLGEAAEFSLLNLRRRQPDEPHFGHLTAFGLLVEDVDALHARALAAGATEDYAPTESPGLPRHSGFVDPSGNRVVLWQG
jgi:predicted enzyme related to lactoylglutathione lyase